MSVIVSVSHCLRQSLSRGYRGAQVQNRAPKSAPEGLRRRRNDGGVDAVARSGLDNASRTRGGSIVAVPHLAGARRRSRRRSRKAAAARHVRSRHGRQPFDRAARARTRRIRQSRRGAFRGQKSRFAKACLRMGQECRTAQRDYQYQPHCHVRFPCVLPARIRLDGSEF
jgi:hypothetical protein